MNRIIIILKSKIMVIKTLKDLQDEGKKVAFVKSNRCINDRDVKAKAKSLRDCGCNLVPLMYVSGAKAVEDGCELVTTDNQPITKDNAADYIVIIDGQHRFKAYLEAQLDPSNLYLFEAYAGKNTQTLLSVANCVTKPWKPADYLVGASLSNKDNELLQACNELQVKGFSLPTISKIYTWGGSLTKAKIAGVMQGKELNVTYNLDRGNKFVEAAKSRFESKFVAKRYLIDVVIDLSSYYKWNTVITALSTISEEDVKKILGAKSSEKPEVIKEVLTSYLTNEQPVRTTTERELTQ